MSVTATGSTGGGTYGLSGSGMDIDAIVKKLMLAEQTKSDALVQKKTVLQWQKAAYNTVYDDLNNFRSSSVFNLKLQSTLTPNKVSSNDTSVVTATANAGAGQINHSLVVAQLASGVSLTSNKAITVASGTKDTLQNQLGVANAFSLTIGNNGATSASISITPGESINDVVSAINSAGVNVQASYDSTLDRFFLATTNTGASTGISITTSNSSGGTGGTDGAAFINALNLGLTSSGTVAGNTTFTSASGKDAVFQLDGTTLNQASNAFTIAGVSYNLAGVTTGATFSGSVAGGDLAVGGTGRATTVGVTSDVDTAVASVQAFVDSYNKILAEVNGKLSETRYTDYPPLTDTQKTAMKDADITAWNTKAQSGMLYNDNTLKTLVNNMRSALSNPISGITGNYKSASSIGITTSGYTEDGKLHLDTTKLTAALKADPNVLQKIFGTAGTTTTTNGVTTTDTTTQGIAGRLYDGINTSLTQLKKIAGTTANSQTDVSSNVAKSIVSYNTQITNEAARFTMIQKAYYTQYNAMEVALSKLSSQGSWLTSQMSTTSSG